MLLGSYFQKPKQLFSCIIELELYSIQENDVSIYLSDYVCDVFMDFVCLNN